jgi:hypothetical protein
MIAKVGDLLNSSDGLRSTIGFSDQDREHADDHLPPGLPVI